MYNGILEKYVLDTVEAHEFSRGRDLLDIAIEKRTTGGGTALSSTDISTLHSVLGDTKMWAHTRAEVLLYAGIGEAMNDTLLYPDGGTPEDHSEGKSTTNGNVRGGGTQRTAGENRVFPNPMADQLSVVYTITGTDGAEIQVEDVSGRRMITQQLSTGVLNTVDVSRLAPGMYLYRIAEGKKTTMTGKVAKY